MSIADNSAAGRARATHDRLLNREKQQRFQLRKSIVPADWIKACDACEEERKARALAAGVWPGHLTGSSLALRNWYPPDTPRYGCRHPRLRADGDWDHSHVPRHLRPPDA
jgi:hypothetical protein